MGSGWSGWMSWNPSWLGFRMAARACRAVSVISARTVGLPVGLVPQDGDVEDLEQPGFEPGWQAGQDVPGEREQVQQAGIGRLGGGFGQGFELGFELLAFVVEFREPGADTSTVCLGSRVVRVGGQVFQF